MNSELITVAEKAFSDKTLAKRFVEAETVEAAQQVMKEAGYELTLDQINEIGDAITIQSANADENGELSEKELETVGGGFVVSGGVILLAGTIVGLCAFAGWLNGRAQSKGSCRH